MPLIEAFWKDLVYTPELLKLQEKHREYLNKKIKLVSQQNHVISEYEHMMRSQDPKRFIWIDRFNIDFNDPDIPDDIKEVTLELKEIEEIYKPFEDKYSKLYIHNVTQLSYRMTPENSITSNIYEDNTRDIISIYLASQKFFLNLTFMHPGRLGKCGMIIIRDIFNYWFNGMPITISHIKYDEIDWYDPNSIFYNIAKTLDDNEDKRIKDNSSIDYYVPTVPIALNAVYRLHAQGMLESYGRTKDFLIIGVTI